MCRVIVFILDYNEEYFIANYQSSFLFSYEFDNSVRLRF